MNILDRIRESVENIEKTKDPNAKMFKAVNVCLKKPYTKLAIQDEDGCYVGDQLGGVLIYIIYSFRVG